MKFIGLILPIYLLFPLKLWASVYAVGDLEGDYDRFVEYLEQNPVFEEALDGRWKLSEGERFVFLGDAVDRGPGSIRVVRTLLQLKEDYPDQVSLILGNRDINKLRVYSILKAHEGKAIPEVIRVPYIKYLNQEHGFNLDLATGLDELRHVAGDFDNQITRLKVILLGMNAPGAFEFAREELALLNGNMEINDRMVFEKLVGDWKEGGEFHEYLRKGQISDIIDGTLYVHGAISSESFGYVPGHESRYKNVNSWSKAINLWAQDEITSWSTDYKEGTGLIEYHAPKTGSISNIKSVVYHRFSDDSGNPVLPKKELTETLVDQGVHRVVVGHTPVQDFPLSVRNSKFELLLTDVSHSKLKHLPLIRIDKDTTALETELESGRKVVTKTRRVRDLFPDGMRTEDGYRIVGRDSKSDKYVLMKVSGTGRTFKTEYIERGLDEIFEIGVKTLNVNGIKNSCEFLFAL